MEEDGYFVLTDQQGSSPISMRLELDGSSDLKKLAQVVLQNSTVTDIDVCVHHTFTQTPQLDTVTFLERIGYSLQGLRKLEFYPGTGNYNAIPIDALGALLRLASRLEVLYVYHLELIGDFESFDAFAQQLRCCHSLKEVCFIDCQISSNVETETSQAQNGSNYRFDPVVRSLASLPSLQVAAIWADDLGSLTNQALVDICGSSNIERLMILGFDINDLQAASMFETLACNHRLRRLNLSCHLGPHASKFLSRMLQRNETLEKLKMEVENTVTSANDAIEVARGLATNSSINYFRLSGQGNIDSDLTMQALESMLERNATLKAFSFLDGSLLTPKMELYLKLNRSNRRFLQQGETLDPEPWIKALSSFNGDIDCLFYFLSINPALCMP